MDKPDNPKLMGAYRILVKWAIRYIEEKRAKTKLVSQMVSILNRRINEGRN